MECARARAAVERACRWPVSDAQLYCAVDDVSQLFVRVAVRLLYTLCRVRVLSLQCRERERGRAPATAVYSDRRADLIVHVE